MQRPPCYKCEERHELCHSHCEKYLKWKKEHDAEREAIRKDAKIGHAMCEIKGFGFKHL